MRIYCVSNSVNSKKYIGKTVRSIEQRFKEHLSCFGKCRVIESAIKKYGADAFTIEEIAVAESQEELDRLEQFWIARLNTVSPHGYNLSGGGEGAGVMNEGTKAIIRANARRPEHLERFEEIRSRPEVRAKMTAGLKARWTDAEYKKKTGAAISSSLNKPDVKVRRSAALRAAWAKPENREPLLARLAEVRADPAAQAKRSAGMCEAHAARSLEEKTQLVDAIRTGKLSPEARARYAATNALPEVRARRSAASTGRVVSAETRLKKSIAATGKKRGPYKNCKPRPAMAAKWADPEWKAAVLAKRSASLAAQLENLRRTNALPETHLRRSLAAAKWQAERKAA